MGGAVFASGPDPLYTPRMPRAVYEAVRDRCHAVLRALFVVVASPIDGPGKRDFGDVDVLVALPQDGSRLDSDTHRLLDEAFARLGAVRSVVVGDGKASMAMPWPGNLSGDVPRSELQQPAHIQVDLTICPSLRACHWALFRHGHGDLWSILGAAVLRPLGLTLDEHALWLRIPEIEHAHRRRSRVWLADEPGVVLAFLGLSAAAPLWEAPFDEATGLFEYCTTCRFFVLPEVVDENKADDRRRLQSRPLFRQWATEYVPALRTSKTEMSTATTTTPTTTSTTPPPPPPTPTRSSTRDAAFAFFPGAQDRYTAALTAWLQEKHLLAIRAAVKAAVPPTLPGRTRGEVCAAVRRQLGIGMDDAAAAAKAAAQWTEVSVAVFVREYVDKAAVKTD